MKRTDPLSIVTSIRDPQQLADQRIIGAEDYLSCLRMSTP